MITRDGSNRKEFVTSFVSVLAGHDGEMTLNDIVRAITSPLSASTKKTYARMMKSFLIKNKHISMSGGYKFTFAKKEWSQDALIELAEEMDNAIRSDKESYRRPSGTPMEKSTIGTKDFGIAFECVDGILSVTVTGDAIKSFRIDQAGDVTLSFVSGKAAGFPTR